MEEDNSRAKIPLQDRTTYDDQLFNSADTTANGDSNRRKRLLFPKRYKISILALLGFCNVYALRVNLSVALVAMVAKNRVTDADGKVVEVLAVIKVNNCFRGSCENL